ncbi:NADP-dependent oxidoreductase [Alkalihalobacillus deserti]|uniref:NADP-dependent oxidoreductase n=1 Tax=Alkalihalobacillus deserti TaxID=2879466 RepID=UPI001D14B0E2|nr:NADP-dependent oxidoreductase [Alkalihalobacillus deserti]
MEKLNRSIHLVSRPTGVPKPENFQLILNHIPKIKEGELLIRTIYLSVDPYMRGRMRGIKTYANPFELNEVLIGGVVGEILETKNPSFKVGEIVEGRLGWADYSVSNGSNLRKVAPRLAPISTALGVVGMPGLTAYFGLLDIGKPRQGETVVVSGAAGAVGMVVGQIAKIRGCHVVGIAGTDQKNQYLKNELGFDETINYKTENVLEALEKTCPKGVDVYFDNVGGDISDAVMNLINFQARIVLCGQIAEYNQEKLEMGPRVHRKLIHSSALMQGFIVSNYVQRQEEGLKQLGEWVNDGTIKYRETIIKGLERAPQAFIGLFSGENIGKQLVKVSYE